MVLPAEFMAANFGRILIIIRSALLSWTDSARREVRHSQPRRGMLRAAIQFTSSFRRAHGKETMQASRPQRSTPNATFDREVCLSREAGVKRFGYCKGTLVAGRRDLAGSR